MSPCNDNQANRLRIHKPEMCFDRLRVVRRLSALENKLPPMGTAARLQLKNRRKNTCRIVFRHLARFALFKSKRKGNDNMPQLKPINECCEPDPITMGCAHSNGKPVAPLTTTSISVRFAPISQIELGIRRFATKPNAKSTVDLRTPLTLANSSATNI